MPAQSKIARMKDRATKHKGTQQINEHELDLWAAYAPKDYDGASSEEPLPVLVKIVPRPRIINKALDYPKEREGHGEVMAAVQKLEVTEISRTYSADKLAPMYWLVLDTDTQPTPEQAQQTSPRIYPRYRLLGSPNLLMREWKLSLIQEA